MILITKEEANYIREKAPSVYISMTGKNKSKGKRKRRYVPETKNVIMLLKEYHSKY